MRRSTLRTGLEGIEGYEESLIVAEVSADSTRSEPFTVPSYGTIDSAVAATSYSCVIEPPEESEAASTRQRDSYAAQQQLLRTLTDLHSGAVEDPAPGAKSTSVTAIMSLMPSSTCSWVCTVPTAGRAPTVRRPCR